jgi:membrane fusion protein, heavy metal efflux system
MKNSTLSICCRILNRRFSGHCRAPGVVRDVTKRVDDRVSASNELLRIESNESLQTYSVRSTFSGRVIERRTNLGDAVDSSRPL